MLKNTAKRAHPQMFVRGRFSHFKLQLPIQTQNSFAAEIQMFLEFQQNEHIPDRYLIDTQTIPLDWLFQFKSAFIETLFRTFETLLSTSLKTDLNLYSKH